MQVSRSFRDQQDIKANITAEDHDRESDVAFLRGSVGTWYTSHTVDLLIFRVDISDN